MAKLKHITIPKATQAEAIARINEVIDPYLENLHVVFEAGTRSIIAEIKEHLINEFEDFGFDYMDLLDD